MRTAKQKQPVNNVVRESPGKASRAGEPSDFLQLKSNEICPCDGGCPRCSGDTLIQTKPLADNIRSLRGGGQPLSQSTREFFEPRFNRDFSNVRVHSDSQAAELAGAVNAKAFTRGSDIVFNTGSFSPGTVAGKHLLAHELTHVIQQSAGANLIQRRRDHVVECLRNNAQGCLLHLHGDEVAALQAAEDLFCDYCVNLLHLDNGPTNSNPRGCRLFRFEVTARPGPTASGTQTTTCCVDPNRIFNNSLLAVNNRGWTNSGWASKWRGWNNRGSSRYAGCGCNPHNLCSRLAFITAARREILAFRNNELMPALHRCRASTSPPAGPLPPNHVVYPVVTFHGNLPSGFGIRSYCSGGSEYGASYRPSRDGALSIRGRSVQFNTGCTRAQPTANPLPNPYIQAAGGGSSPRNLDDFILVTRPEDFLTFVLQRRNVVLQSPNAPNDGSLSVFLHSGQYINIEAQRPNPPSASAGRARRARYLRAQQSSRSVQRGMGERALVDILGAALASGGGCPVARTQGTCPNCTARTAPTTGAKGDRQEMK